MYAYPKCGDWCTMVLIPCTTNLAYGKGIGGLLIVFVSMHYTCTMNNSFTWTIAYLLLLFSFLLIPCLLLSSCWLLYNQERRIKEIVLKAMGQAINKSVAVAEIIKVILLLALYCCIFGQQINHIWQTFFWNRKESLGYIRIPISALSASLMSGNP